MGVKALGNSIFEPAAQRTLSGNGQSPQSPGAEIQFREDLWREYRREGISAGFDAAQATAYANALSPEMGLAAGVSGMAPLRGGWFYQSRTRVAQRTIASGLMKLTRPDRRGSFRGTAANGAEILLNGFRLWKTRGRS